MILTVLTEGGIDAGFGHITRCISISNAFELKGFKVEFMVYGDSSVNKVLEKFNYKKVDWIKDFKKLKKIINKSSLILLDSISASRDQISRISSLEVPIIHIDDEKHHNIINNGFILDWTINLDPKKIFPTKKDNVDYLLGSEFTPLREDFYQKNTFSTKKEINQIMVTFGGSDVKNMTPKILENLINYYPEIRKKIIIGDGFQNLSSIEKNVDRNTELIFGASAKKIFDTMNESDLAVASGGQTLYELARVGLPTLAIIIVDNALFDTNGWHEVGFLRNIGWHNDQYLMDNLKTSIEDLEDFSVRKLMSENGQKRMQNNGAKLIANNIMRKLHESF